MREQAEGTTTTKRKKRGWGKDEKRRTATRQQRPLFAWQMDKNREEIKLREGQTESNQEGRGQEGANDSLLIIRIYVIHTRRRRKR